MRVTMEMNNDKKDIETTEREESPAYRSPKIITYTRDEILDEIGPAQACSPSPCVLLP